MAPHTNAKEVSNEQLQNVKEISSSNQILPIPDETHNISHFSHKENGINSCSNICKSKENNTQVISKRKEILSQEKKVQQLLNQLNSRLTESIGFNLTVADVTGNYKPLYKEFEKLPAIHFESSLDKQQLYHTTPFKKINSYQSTFSSKYSSSGKQVEAVENNLNLLSENNHLIRTRYCGHCKNHFISGAAHRLTRYHQSMISSSDHWKRIDELFQRIHKNPINGNKNKY